MFVSRSALVLAAAALLLSGCTDAPAASSRRGQDGTATQRQEFAQYVALGDSFTAGPYVPVTDLAQGCLRSNGNYPSLIAERLEISHLSDVSCSAAEIADLARPQRTFRSSRVPPQLDALTSRTDLVTLSIGGNDFNLFGDLLQTCSRLRVFDPDGAPCTKQLTREGFDPVAQTKKIRLRLEAAIAEVRRRAPGAQVLLVGYPRIGPSRGTCPRLLPLADGDYVTADRVAKALSRAMRLAADNTQVGFLDMYASSRGHDVCAEVPWVNGRFTNQQSALAFHPLAAGMEAISDRIVARLGPTPR